MSFPEIPLLVYPSLARKYGVEESILLGLCQQLLNAQDFVEWLPLEASSDEENPAGKNAPVRLRKLQISLVKWRSLTSLWEEHKLHNLTESLQIQQRLKIVIHDRQVTLIELDSRSVNRSQESQTNVSQQGSRPLTQNASFDSAKAPLKNSLKISADRLNNSSTAAHKGKQQQREPTSVLPVYDVPPAPELLPLPKRNPEIGKAFETRSGGVLKGIGPAPSFGGSTGWKKRTGDELQIIFDQQEILNKQLHSITVQWRPSALFYSTLSRNNIPQEFADSCLDEFILFYCDKNKKERSWDHKFLAWVKRAWIKQQSNDNRNTAPSQQIGSRNENSQRDTREKRKRITAAIMDIHDTNW